MPFRPFFALLAVFVAAVPLGGASAVPGASVARVVAVQPARVADLILLNAGFEAGLRQGMTCRVTRGRTEIAEILVVELRPNFSAALITGAAPRQAIRAGDSVAIKTVKS